MGSRADEALTPSKGSGWGGFRGGWKVRIRWRRGNTARTSRRARDVSHPVSDLVPGRRTGGIDVPRSPLKGWPALLLGEDGQLGELRGRVADVLEALGDDAFGHGE